MPPTEFGFSSKLGSNAISAGSDAAFSFSLSTQLSCLGPSAKQAHSSLGRPVAAPEVIFSMSFSSSSNRKASPHRIISSKNHEFVPVQRAVEAERCCALPLLSRCCAFLLTLTPCAQHRMSQSRYRNNTRVTLWEIGEGNRLICPPNLHERARHLFACQCPVYSIFLSALLCCPTLLRSLCHGARRRGPLWPWLKRYIPAACTLAFFSLSRLCARSTEQPRTSPSSFVIPTTASLLSRAFVLQRRKRNTSSCTRYS